jgi:cytochrome c5
VIISVIAGLLAPLLAIFLVVQLIRGIQEKQVDTDTTEAANKAVVERIKPFATLAAQDANSPRVEQSGEQVFTAVCSSCHTPGALGAPKFNSKSDWGPRLGQGFDTLVKHAIEGIRQMPARGGNPDLSDIEVARAVAYMANSGGASFKEPAAEAAAAPGAGAAKIDLVKGQATYTATCAACHGTGVAGAPKLGDKAAWAPRIQQSFEALYTNALKGKNAMPAKGGNADLAEADLANAVAYMVKEAGGKVPDMAPGGAPAPATKTEAAPADKAASSAAAPAPSPAVPAAPAAPAVTPPAKAAPAAASPAKSVAAPAAPAAPAPAPAPVKSAALSGKGEAIYKQTCAVCHAAGVAGAPKLGDKAAWGPRLAKGMDTLHTSALKGLRAMPAKGGNPSLADADVMAAVDYMASQAK